MLYLLYEKEANGERCQDAEIGKRKTLGHAIQHKPALNDSPNAETGVRHRSHKSPIMICKRDLTSIGKRSSRDSRVQPTGITNMVSAILGGLAEVRPKACLGSLPEWSPSWFGGTWYLVFGFEEAAHGKRRKVENS